MITLRVTIMTMTMMTVMTNNNKNDNNNDDNADNDKNNNDNNDEKPCFATSNCSSMTVMEHCPVIFDRYKHEETK